MIFPQFLLALCEWVNLSDIYRHKRLVRELYLRGFETADAGDFLSHYIKQTKS